MEEYNMRRGVLRSLITGATVILLLSVGVSVFSQQVSSERHPNLAAAQQFIQSAVDKLTEAQKANNYDMKGHAAKAKQLLGQAYNEIWLAAQAANAAQ
jgi:putative Ca2+/H+ antiporter (TMEM165/GDT1 family)